MRTCFQPDIAERGLILPSKVYKDYFLTFFAQQGRKVQDKIIKILDIIEQLERLAKSNV